MTKTTSPAKEAPKPDGAKPETKPEASNSGVPVKARDGSAHPHPGSHTRVGTIHLTIDSHNRTLKRGVWENTYNLQKVCLMTTLLKYIMIFTYDDFDASKMESYV